MLTGCSNQSTKELMIETSKDSVEQIVTESEVVEETVVKQFQVLKGVLARTYNEVPVLDPDEESHSVVIFKESFGDMIIFENYTIGRIEGFDEVSSDDSVEEFLIKMCDSVETYLDSDGALEVSRYQNDKFEAHQIDLMKLGSYSAYILDGSFKMIDNNDLDTDVHYYAYAVNFNGTPILYMVYDLDQSNVEKGKPVLDDMMLTFREWRDTDSE